MNSNQRSQGSRTSHPPKIRQVLLEDLRQGGIPGTFWQDLKEIYHFYLDQETKQRLMAMGRVRRGIHVAIWLVKSLILKLNPLRRLLLVAAIILVLLGNSDVRLNQDVHISSNFSYVGFLLVLLILMLELKDKLLAQDELAVGRAVQRAFIPSTHPHLPGWDIWLYTHPANEVGGDLVDYLQLDEQRLHLTLADVAGKGLGAALLMSKLQATLRALAPNFRSLTELAARVNEILCRDGLPNRFASMVYLELGSNSARVGMLNAGHLPPIRIGSQEIDILPHGSLALGLQPSSLFNEQQITMQPGEILLIYSDGLTEARNEAGEFYGEQRLLDFLQLAPELSAQALGQRLILELERYSAGARRYDDVSLIVVKRLS
ncbi:MAG: serine/threonine-protein phosphatase [candidate division KSB1 bacterium]|nr:serine/threonine-protein phosphatase [candidate division KSB1 bacterium]